MTEMQTFISNCNDTVESIAELVYDDVTPMLDNMFQENITIYINLESHLSNTSQQTPQVRLDLIGEWRNTDLVIAVSSFVSLVNFTKATGDISHSHYPRSLSNLICLNTLQD